MQISFALSVTVLWFPTLLKMHKLRLARPGRGMQSVTWRYCTVLCLWNIQSFLWSLLLISHLLETIYCASYNYYNCAKIKAVCLSVVTWKLTLWRKSQNTEDAIVIQWDINGHIFLNLLSSFKYPRSLVKYLNLFFSKTTKSPLRFSKQSYIHVVELYHVTCN